MCTKKIILAAFIGLVWCGCERKSSDNSIEVIELNPHEAAEYVNLSEIVDSVKCIKLQADTSDIMGRISCISIGKKYIYAQDAIQNILFIFDREGKFVSKLAKKGPGPDEYNSIYQYFVDFELIESEPFPALNGMMERNAGIYYYITCQMDNVINDRKTNAGLIVMDEKYNMKILFDKKIETAHQYFIAYTGCYARNENDQLFASFPYDNTFYRLDNGEAYPALSVDFGQYGMNNERTGSEPTEKQIKYFKESSNIASFPVLAVNNAGLISFSYFFKQDVTARWYNRNDYCYYIRIGKKGSEKVWHTRQFRNDLSSFPDQACIRADSYGCIHEVWYEDYLIDAVIPANYFTDDKPEKIFVEGIGEITADDDPIIVFMKLKKNI